jgi:hypothetical protein
MVTKAFTKLTSPAAATSSDECQNFGTFIANKLQNYLPCTRNKVQQEINHIIFTANQGLLMFRILSPLLSYYSFLCFWFRRHKSD